MNAAGDVFGQTLVNEFAGGPPPALPIVGDVLGGVLDDLDFANAVRRILVESYIADATPGVDGNPGRSLLPDGDVSDDATPGIGFDAPVQFIFEALVKPFVGDPTSPAGSPQTTINLDLGTNTLSRTTTATDSFILDGFLPGHAIRLTGFGSGIDGLYTIGVITPGTITVIEDIPGSGSVAGSGDEQILVQGTRGAILDIFMNLRRGLNTLLTVLGGAPTSSLDTLLTQVPGWQATLASNPTDATALAGMQSVTAAYLKSWIDAIDDGVKNWAEIGLAMTRAMVDPAVRRFWQNDIARNEGPDVGPDRGAIENAVGLLDVLTAELDDPNHDGILNDSFLAGHLVPMLGILPFLGQFKTLILDFGRLLDDSVIGPARLLVNPVLDAIGNTRGVVQNFFMGIVEDTLGVSFGQFELLAGLSSKMDVKKLLGVTIFQPGDRAKLDGLMGIGAGAHLGGTPDANPGVEYYANPAGRLADNVEFNKSTFAAYANSVSLAKMALLQEVDPLGGAGLHVGRLSALATNGLTALSTPLAYDWTELNLVGGHGGNVLTTTLPQSLEVAYTAVNLLAKTIDVGPNSGLVTGDYVRYAPGTGGTAITGLVVGLTYQVTMSGNLASLSASPLPGITIPTPIPWLGGSGPQRLLPVERRELLKLSVNSLNLTDILLDKLVDSRPWLASTAEGEQWREGTGNFPLWESEILRPLFRAFFDDWQHGVNDFPDLVDATSPDPNTNVRLVVGAVVAPFVSVFDAPDLSGVLSLPTAVGMPAAADYTITGTQGIAPLVNVPGVGMVAVIGSVTGNGDASPDDLLVDYSATPGSVIFVVGIIGGNGLRHVTLKADTIVVLPGAMISSRKISDGELSRHHELHRRLGRHPDRRQGRPHRLRGDDRRQRQQPTRGHPPQRWHPHDRATDTGGTAFGFELGGDGLRSSGATAILDIGLAAFISGDNVNLEADAVRRVRPPTCSTCSPPSDRGADHSAAPHCSRSATVLPLSRPAGELAHQHHRQRGRRGDLHGRRAHRPDRLRPVRPADSEHPGQVVHLPRDGHRRPRRPRGRQGEGEARRLRRVDRQQPRRRTGVGIGFASSAPVVLVTVLPGATVKAGGDVVAKASTLNHARRAARGHHQRHFVLGISVSFAKTASVSPGRLRGRLAAHRRQRRHRHRAQRERHREHRPVLRLRRQHRARRRRGGHRHRRLHVDRHRHGRAAS